MQDLDGLVTAKEAELAAQRGVVENARKTLVDDGSSSGSSAKVKAAKLFYVKEWMVRKKKCVVALDNVESMSDGAISKKRVLNGEGPIEVEGDERHVRNAVAAAKAPKKLGSKKRKLASGEAAKSGGSGDSDFVAIKLHESATLSNLVTERVYAE